MWDKFYIVVLDRGGLLDTFDYKTFHKKITTANGVNSWWHYLDTTYILKVEFGITSKEISAFIRSKAPNKKFIVVELNLGDRNGWLPKEAWDWIKKHNDQQQ